MKEEKFKVIQFVKEFIIDIEKELENFPKKDIEIKSWMTELLVQLGIIEQGELTKF